MKRSLQGALLGMVLAPCLALAQNYPSKSIRLVVPYAAGGAADTVARALAPRLIEALGQQIIVDNRAGASSVIGSDIVARAAPDGYTLLMTVGPPHGVHALFAKAVPFDSVADFTPIAVVGTAPQAIVVNPSLQVSSVRELIAYAKKNPGKLSFGTSGNGSSQHLGGLLLNRMADIDTVHVPYKGGGPALTDVIGGQIPMGIIILSNVIPHANAGKVKVLAVIEAQRAKAAPDTPTVAEGGVPGYALPDTWIGLLGPAKLAPALVAQLHAAVVKSTAAADVRQRLDATGFEVKEGTPQDFASLIARAYETYRKIAGDAGIRPE